MADQFPIFKKYANDKNYFCIQSETSVLEIFKNGKKWQCNKWEIKTFADRNQLEYLLKNNDFVKSIKKEEFEEKLAMLT